MTDVGAQASKMAGRGGRPAGVPWLWLLALLAGGLALRLAGLTERGLWLDEWVSLDVASHPWLEIATGRVFDNHTPPLYYLLLRGWQGLVGDGLAAARGLSVLLDLAVLALLTQFAGRWFGRRVGLAAGLAYAASPFAVRVAQEARMYPLLMLLVLAAAVLVVEGERRPGRWWPAALLAPVAAAALYSHYFAALSLAALGGVVAWRWWRLPDGASRRACRRLVAALAAAGLAFLPWLPVLARLLRSGGQSFRGTGWSEIPQAVLRFTVGYSVLPSTVGAKGDMWGWALGHLPLLLALGAAAAGMVLLGALRLLRRGGGERAGGRGILSPLVLALACVPAILGLVISSVAPSLDERYLAASFPFLLVLAVLGVEGAHRQRRPVASLGVVAGAAALVTLGAVGTVAQVLDPDAGATPWRPAAEELRRVAAPGARVVVAPGFYAPLVETYLGDRFEVVGNEHLPEHRGSGESWGLEVVFLTAGEGPPSAPGWRAEEHRMFSDGNGIRLWRLRPAVSPPSSLGPSPPPTGRPSPPAPPPPASGRAP